MAHTERILIVGGGIAGLTLATALHQYGFRVELVERSLLWHATGAAIQLHANAMRILHALGLGTAVEQAGAVIRHWIFCDQDGEVLCETDLEDVWGKVGPCIAIDRPRLQNILTRRTSGSCSAMDASLGSRLFEMDRPMFLGQSGCHAHMTRYQVALSA